MNPNQDRDRSSFSRFRDDRALHPERRAVLAVEDNPGDIFLIQRAVANAHLDVDLYFMGDGAEVLQFFSGIEEGKVRCPELLLLDLNIPSASGYQVLAYLRNSRRCVSMPAVVMTSSSAEADREKSGSFGIEQYFTKPATYDEFMVLGEIVKKFV